MAATAGGRGPNTNAPAAAAAGRRLLSRLTQPFAARARAVSEHHIRPQEPHRAFSPGDVVRGAVVLTVVKPVRITHLVVCLRGYVRVLRSGAADEALPGSDAFWSPGRGRRPGEYFGNGFASLFQDEVVLCGEGRLEAGVYEFNFELDFPRGTLPSSIDFERGTISYAISSTLTRPTTVSPTSTCDRKISLVETVDVGPLQQPRSRQITLEPIRRRPKAARSAPRPDTASRRQSQASRLNSDAGVASIGPDSTSVRTSEEQREPPQSPTQSDVSGASVASSSSGTGSFTVRSRSSLARPGPVADKTITATVELLRAGCLRGDALPLTVRVAHTKPIKSLHGVIITLYRQGRIDSHPALPLGPSVGGPRPGTTKREDYYPKSRTGLGGLSLSSAGSSSVFRKDLAQTFAPLIVDPQTLTAEVRAAVRVPDDVFPTIASVPGAIISFRYYVEVVVDLNGKLARQDHLVTAIGAGTNQSKRGAEDILTAIGGGIMDTDQIRREKSVVACLFEVVVGTTDSSKGRIRRTREQRQSEEEPDRRLDEADAENHEPGHDQIEAHHAQSTLQPPADIPLPEVTPGEVMDEKTALRRAEESLLPSAPSRSLEASRPSSRGPSAPTMPEIHEEHDGASDWGDIRQTTPSAPPPELVGPSSDHAGSSLQESWPAMSEDKQELERRRLQLEASAPAEGPSADEEDGEGAASGPAALPPSAPTLGEEEYGSHQDYGASTGPAVGQAAGETLPRYER
ncbi:MAG: ph-response sensor protein [Thelocarpon impressellum]|nr:MAG: ph-response sensor protein [Thelocarpon impressellum]